MADNSKFFTGVLLGAAAGAAIGYFLTTDKGKEIMEDLKSAAGKAADKVKDTVQKWTDEVEEERTTVNT